MLILTQNSAYVKHHSEKDVFLTIVFAVFATVGLCHGFKSAYIKKIIFFSLKDFYFKAMFGIIGFD